MSSAQIITVTESGTPEPRPVVDPASASEAAAWLAIAAALLFVFLFKLVAALIAGLLVYTVLQGTTRLLHGRLFSHGTAKVLSALLVGLIAVSITAVIVLLLVGVVRGRVGEIPTLFQKVAETLDVTRTSLRNWGIGDFLPEAVKDAEDVQTFASAWLREHAAAKKASGAVGHMLAHATVGIVIGLLVFFRHGAPSGRPLAAALVERVKRLQNAFQMVTFAQVEISGLNTVLTAVYLFGILPLTGHRLPLSGSLLAVTFLAGLIPVAGNLISNSVIVILSLGISPWVAIGSLIFLVVIHKLEYFVNARIVGSRIHASAWEILLAIFIFEVAFGVAGVILAPVIYAYVKRELTDRALV
ncbi:MAG: AI-2E family transporter [Thermoanaerobaculia bacterium]